MMARLFRRAGTWLLQPCLLLVWMLLATGCNATTTHPGPVALATATTIPTTTPNTTPTLPTPNTTPLDITSAWGKVAIRHIADTLDADHFLNFGLASTPDGQHALVTIAPSNFINAQHLPSFVGVYDLGTGNLIKIHKIPGSEGQILTAGADNRYMVWLETTDQNTSRWTMWLYDLQTRQLQQIGQNSTDAQGQPVSGTYPTPWVSNGHLIWGQQTGEITRLDVSKDIIQLMDLTTRQTQTIATSAGLPTLAWPWMAYAQGDTQGNAVGVIKNLSTGQTLQWQDDGLPHLQSMAIRGNSIAYSLLAGNPSSVEYIADFTQNTTPVTLIKGHDGSDYVDFVTINDRLISWEAANTSTTQVWDRKLNRIVTLPSESTGGSTVLSTLLYWTTSTVSADQASQLKKQGIIPPYVYNVVDTTSLP